MFDTTPDFVVIERRHAQAAHERAAMEGEKFADLLEELEHDMARAVRGEQRAVPWYELAQGSLAPREVLASYPDALAKVLAECIGIELDLRAVFMRSRCARVVTLRSMVADRMMLDLDSTAMDALTTHPCLQQLSLVLAAATCPLVQKLRDTIAKAYAQKVGHFIRDARRD